jgi:hypothetical protein
VPFGYWEAKDSDDDLDKEISKKLARGYPQDNIIFEDSKTAVLIQNRREVLRCSIDEPKELEKLLRLFFSYERAEIAEFRKAVEQFTTDLPAVLKALREMIEQAFRDSAAFRGAAQVFLKHAQEVINPTYRGKYAINLKREFPRIPFYPDFWQWADWGKELVDLHVGYEQVKPWDLTLAHVTTPGPSSSRKKRADYENRAKAILKADKEGGRIVIDSVTSLGGIPREAWEYRLGNRSALEWILDQYQESKPKDPTIRAKFDTYRFVEYQEKVIDLLARVTRVSVETQRIIAMMRDAPH